MHFIFPEFFVAGTALSMGLQRNDITAHECAKMLSPNSILFWWMKIKKQINDTIYVLST
jgi:hypothetical protein